MGRDSKPPHNQKPIMKTKFKINGEDATLIEFADNKMQQLGEAIALLEDFSDRIAWADDFANHACIKEALDSVYAAIEHSKDELEEIQTELEDEMESYKKDKEMKDEDFERNSDLAYALAE